MVLQATRYRRLIFIYFSLFMLNSHSALEKLTAEQERQPDRLLRPLPHRRHQDHGFYTADALPEDRLAAQHRGRPRTLSQINHVLT
jgi:hypothetical protein